MGDMTLGGGIVLPHAQNVGFKRNQSSPAYTWKDIIGHVQPKASGAGTPARTLHSTGVYDYSFIAGDSTDFSFHIPHDYAMGTNLYYHVHWSHTGTSISGNAVFTTALTYAKGHNQANFSTPVSPTITYDTVDIATTPQRRHRIDEIQLSASSPSGTQIDTDDIEPDGLIIMTLTLTTLPTIGGGGSLFIHFSDLHYQTIDAGGTISKVPSFWTPI